MGKNSKGVFDLEKHFAFYGAYHKDPRNVSIHMLCVWPILFTAVLLLCFTPSLPGLPRLGIYVLGNHFFLELNFGFLLAISYAVFYVCLEPKAGSLAAILCLLCWVAGSILGGILGFSLAWKVVLVAQVLCWTGQFIGHGVFEKRAPALLDNLVQALVMAPFFVLLEAMQSLFDYEPYPGFHARVQARISAETSERQDLNQKFVS